MERVGPWELVERLVVEDTTELWRAVAFASPDARDATGELRCLLPQLAADLELWDDVRSESLVRARLDDERVPRLLDAGVGDRIGPYCVFEAIPRVSVAELIRRTARLGGAAVPLACTITRAMAALIDVIPAPDILFDPASLAVSLEGAPLLTRLRPTTARRRGTLRYSAPELMRGLPASATTRVFSLGAVLYELVTGVRAFQGATDFETLQSVRDVQMIRVEERRPDVPPELAQLIARMLIRDPNQRIPAADVVTHLDRRLDWALWSPELVAREVRALVPT